MLYKLFNTIPENNRVALYNYPAVPASYASNHQMMPDNNNVTALAAVNAPASKILITEFKGTTNNNWNDYASPWWTGTGNWDQGFAGHSNMMNNVFADGHAKAMKPQATGRPLNMWGSFDNMTDACKGAWINCDDAVLDPQNTGLTNLGNRGR